MSAIVEAVCTFDEATHTYRRGDKILPSVSTIIQAVWPRTDGAPEDMIEKARLRGTFVDEKFMEYLAAGSVTVPAGTPQEYADCLGQACDWWDSERRGAKVECQVRLFGEREAGTADFIINDCEIIDLKSTYEISKTVPAQLGGYGSLFEETKSDNRHLKFGVLHVHKRMKKAKFVETPYDSAISQWEIVRDFYRLVNAK